MHPVTWQATAGRPWQRAAGVTPPTAGKQNIDRLLADIAKLKTTLSSSGGSGASAAATTN